MDRSDPDQRVWRSFRPGISEMDPSAPGGPNNGRALTKGKALSNAMRTSKSTLAGVAAGALVAGVIPFALLTGSASAATGTASVSPVRYTDGVTVPKARASFDLDMDGTTSVALTVAPAGGTISIDDTSASLGSPGVDVVVNNGGTDDSYVNMKVNKAGTYTGSIYDGDDTATFSFTTVGSPASMTLTPASQTVLVGATANLTVTLLDASGNVTQPATVDSVGLAVDTDDTLSAASLSSTDLYDGTAAITLTTTGNPAGTATVTASPLGTLPSYGLTAQTAAVVKSGSVSAVDAASVMVSSPSNAISAPANTDDTVDRAVKVPTGTSSVTLTIDDTTANAAGTQLRFKLTPSAGTVTVGSDSGSSSSALFVDVTTDSNRQATIAASLSGAAILNSATLTVKQVDVSDSNVSGGTGVVVTQADRAVSASTISVSPDDSVVGAIGTAVPVTVTVADQFGDPQAGWTVNAYRGATVSGGTYLNQGVTNSSGEATVSVINADGVTTGTMENYSFSAQPTLGSVVNKQNPLQVTWTTDGGITSLSVVLGVGSSPISDPAGTAPTTGPLLTVPYDGTASSASTATFNLETEAAGGTANGGETVSLTPTATPQNNVTVTVPLGSTGIYVSESSSTAWDEGKTSVTVSSGTAVYVFGTKVGRTSVELTSGGKTVTVEVMIQTATDAAYNIGISPSEQSLAAGALGTAVVSVTDVFGNPVAAGDDTGVVTVTASGQVLLAGYAQTQNVSTGADGTATVTIIAANASGTGTLSAGPKSGDAAPAWQTGYTAPTNAPDPITSAAATVLVSESSVKTITITGERGTVKGKPGIMVDGITTGFDEGDLMVPYIKFPGETSYSEGTARPAVDAEGEFYWQRKTGKKIYVYFKNEDGTVKSERIIIQAK